MFTVSASIVLGVAVIDPGGVENTCSGLGEVLAEEYWETG